MANHHPAPELLAAFSAGSLQLSHALCISTHIEHCNECQSNLHRLNNMGATLFEQLETSNVSSTLKDNVFEQLDATIAENDSTSQPAGNPNTPKALQQFVPENYDALDWHYLSPGIRFSNLCTDSNGAKVRLIHIKPGGKVATHTHTGDEYTLILEGSFSDESGFYGEGDFILRDGRHKHKPIATKDKACICLVVTDAPIEFTGFFTRWLNPLIRKAYLPAL